MLRGLFLGCGSVNAPSSRYHLEFVAPTSTWATAISEVADSVGTKVGIMERGGQHVVYVKEGDAIVRLLSLMGASRAVMEFESVRVVREVSGEVNRRLNFETANIGKTIGSGMRQAAAIEQLQAAGRLQQLPPALREMARWRSANPQLNLGELAGRMKLSKSAVNHRLRRLQELAGPNGDVATPAGITTPSVDTVPRAFLAICSRRSSSRISVSYSSKRERSPGARSRLKLANLAVTESKILRFCSRRAARSAAVPPAPNKRSKATCGSSSIGNGWVGLAQEMVFE